MRVFLLFFLFFSFPLNSEVLKESKFFDHYIERNLNSTNCGTFWKNFPIQAKDLSPKVLKERINCPDAVLDTIRQLTKQVNQNPRDGETLYLLALAHSENGNCKRALFYLVQSNKRKLKISLKELWQLWPCLDKGLRRNLILSSEKNMNIWRFFDPKMMLPYLSKNLKKKEFLALSTLFWVGNNLKSFNLNKKEKRAYNRLIRSHKKHLLRLKKNPKRLRSWTKGSYKKMLKLCRQLFEERSKLGRSFFSEPWFQDAFLALPKLHLCKAKLRKGLFDHRGAEKELVRAYVLGEKSERVLIQLAELRSKLGLYYKSYFAMVLLKKKRDLSIKETKEFLKYGILSDLKAEKLLSDLQLAKDGFKGEDFHRLEVLAYLKYKRMDKLGGILIKIKDEPLRLYSNWKFFLSLGDTDKALMFENKLKTDFPDHPILSKGP